MLDNKTENGSRILTRSRSRSITSVDMGGAERNTSFVLFGVYMLMGCALLHRSYKTY
jgi:hypothetical protein